MVKSLDFFLSYNKYFSSETFFVFVKSYSISPACQGNSFIPAGVFFFKLSIDHLFHNLESGKRNYCLEKSGESLEFWIKNLYKPCAYVPEKESHAS